MSEQRPTTISSQNVQTYNSQEEAAQSPAIKSSVYRPVSEVPLSNTMLSMDFEKLLESQDTARLSLSDFQLENFGSNRISLIYSKGEDSVIPTHTDTAAAAHFENNVDIQKSQLQTSSSSSTTTIVNNLQIMPVNPVTLPTPPITPSKSNQLMSHPTSLPISSTSSGTATTTTITTISTSASSSSDMSYSQEDQESLSEKLPSSGTSSLVEFFRTTGPDLTPVASSPTTTASPKKKKSSSILSKFIKSRKEKDEKVETTDNKQIQQQYQQQQYQLQQQLHLQQHMSMDLKQAYPPQQTFNNTVGSSSSAASRLDYSQLPPEKQTSRTHSLGYQKQFQGNVNDKSRNSTHNQDEFEHLYGSAASDMRHGDAYDVDDYNDQLPFTAEDELLLKNTELNARTNTFDPATMSAPEKKTHNKKVFFNQTVIEIECEYLSSEDETDYSQVGFRYGFEQQVDQRQPGNGKLPPPARASVNNMAFLPLTLDGLNESLVPELFNKMEDAENMFIGSNKREITNNRNSSISITKSNTTQENVNTSATPQSEFVSHPAVVPTAQQIQQNANISNHRASMISSYEQTSSAAKFNTNRVSTPPPTVASPSPSVSSNLSIQSAPIPLAGAQPQKKVKRKVRHVQIQTRLQGSENAIQTSPTLMESVLGFKDPENMISQEDHELVVEKSQALEQMVADLQLALESAHNQLNQVQEDKRVQQEKFDNLSGQAYKKIKDLLSERYMMEIEMETLKNQNQALEGELHKWIHQDQQQSKP